MIFRVAISGSPGVGKSSFIEALGKELTEGRNLKIAVLTIDPTSAVTGGSILGDLTRMQELSRNPKAYIRQSPTSGSLGGVARGIHEAVILCEGAGYDCTDICITLTYMSYRFIFLDFYLFVRLILSPLGVKRGIVELSDLLVITKDDGDLKSKAKLTQAEYISALKYVRPRIDAWKPKVLRSSIMNHQSIAVVCDTMFEYWNTIMESGDLEQRRVKQMTQWMWNHVQDELLRVFKQHPRIVPLAPSLEKDVREGKITPGLASEVMIRTFLNT
ncbi:unnamed protein product [Angiostrongylus costaricensis]|uniref:AAA domain-containing protein n=1 Tax=Angiostrongylus costaricensis TaxID=334426 RepID=A0A0R3PQ53_ANGCS|nr:unnamed protein product [Angiostrongylus costaricensis]